VVKKIKLEALKIYGVVSGEHVTSYIFLKEIKKIQRSPMD
jgi:hypothetical protein